MRTGMDVITHVYGLLGYTDAKGNVNIIKNTKLYNTAVNAVIQIYNDLARIDVVGRAEIPFEDMSQIVPLSYDTVNDIMPYGVAMLIARIAGDDEAQSFFAESYNQKRRGIERKDKSRKDVIPRGTI